MKKVTSVIVMIFVMFFAINVKAYEWQSVNPTLEKGDNSSELYNSMPTEVQKGDIISVKLIIKNIQGWNINNGNDVISWDKEAFELVETNGKYYSGTNNDLDFASVTFSTKETNLVYVYYEWEDTPVTVNDVTVLELKFKVKSNAKDGIYKITQEYMAEGLLIHDDNDYYNVDMSSKTLQYQIGKSKISSNYSNSEIPTNTYIIGNHMFTHNVSTVNDYPGYLTTQYIMLASKSIESNNKDDMIIYVKDVRGAWRNAIDDELITPQDEFKIEYIDMMANYSENGVYSDNNDKNILRIVQISETEAIVTIENDKERIHGIATINNGVATLSIGSGNSQKNYQINISSNSVATIQTNDSNVTSGSLQKRANVSINDYYNSAYTVGFYDFYEYPLYYLNSSHTGKYTYGNYELYLLRANEYAAKVCIREKGNSACIFEDDVFGNEGFLNYSGTKETTYADWISGDSIIGLDWNNGQIKIECIRGTCENTQYLGNYTKEKDFTMEEVFRLWEKNEIQYNITLDMNNGDPSVSYYLSQGDLVPYGYGYYNPEKPENVFVGWLLNGELFDLNTPITGPMTLVASYRGLPSKPELSIAPQGVGHDYVEYDADFDVFIYNLSIDLNEEYDGFGIFTTLDSENPIAVSEGDEPVSITIGTNVEKVLYARAYIESYGERYYGVSSDTITLHPVKYTVTFDSNGGSNVPSQTVPYGETIEVPDTPTKSALFDFVAWKYNNQNFDFNTGIMDNITLVAEWHNNLALPEVGDGLTNNFYQHGLFLSNFDGMYNPQTNVNEGYCTSLSGCVGDETDHYRITGFEVFKKVGSEYQRISDNNGKTQFAPYEHFELTVEPKEVDNYVIRAFVREGAEIVAYSEYSDEYQIDSSYVAPEIAFDSNGGTPDPANEVEKWVKVTNLVDDYGFADCDGGVCASYKVEGFELYNKVLVGNEYEYQSLVSVGVGSSMHVIANYGEELHLYARAYARNSSGNPIYSDYSDELILYEEEPVEPLCYLDGSNGYHWTNAPETGWTEVNGVTSQTDCHAAYMCYLDGSNEYHWTYEPETGWTEVNGVTSQTDCHAPTPTYACYVDGDDGYHWSNNPDGSWTEVQGVDDETDCHASSSGGDAACYFDTDLFEYHWTDNPDPAWVAFPGITDENTCHS